MSAREQQQTKVAAPQPPMSPHKERMASVELLRQLLARQLDLYDKLLQCATAKREAIRTADIDAVTSQCQREQTLLTSLHDLELKREPIVRHLAALLEIRVDADVAITSREIAERLDEPDRGALQALTAQLKQRIEEVRRTHSVIRQATDALSRHMNGVMQSVQTALNHSGVYERKGRLATAGNMVRSIDITS